MVEVKIKLKNPTLKLPEYKSGGAAGMDLSSAEDGVIMPGERKLISTGIFMEIPDGWEGQVRPRSGLAVKHGIGMLNSPGTIDSDYRGEVGVILYNSSDKPFEYVKGDRIAQIVFAKTEKVIIKEVDSLSVSERGMGGFGSTGT